MQASPGLDDFLELAGMRAPFRTQLVAIMAADAAGAWLVDRALRRVFPLQRRSGVLALQ